MKISMKYGLVLLLILMAFSFGVALGAKNNTAADNVMPSNASKFTAGSNVAVADVADAKENETVDQNESIEDSVIINNINYGKIAQSVEIKNNETSVQNMTGWRLEVQNKMVFTFPKFVLGAKARVFIHSGMGSDSKTDLYAKTTMLTKADEEVSLLDANGNIVSTSEEPKEKSDQSDDA